MTIDKAQSDCLHIKEVFLKQKRKRRYLLINKNAKKQAKKIILCRLNSFFSSHLQEVTLIVIEFNLRTTPVWKSVKLLLDEDDSN